MKAFAKVSFIAIAALGVAGAHAAEGHMHHGMMVAQADMKMVDGEVRKVDKAAGKITLAHGALVNLGMPAMTMAFPVKDAKWLDQVKPGDKIRFMADKVAGIVTVVHLEKAK